jgi:GNAT superfamily N-acetyltransferase
MRECADDGAKIVQPFICAMNVVIRRAEPSDVPRMLELVKELALFEKAPEAVTVTETEMHEAGFGPNAVWVGWVAEEEGVIHGMAICYARYSTWRGRALYLEDIVVTEAARGQSIGDRLIRACIGYAAANNYNRMRWQVLDWNTDAMRFYERFGASFDDGWVNVELDKETIQKLGNA